MPLRKLILMPYGIAGALLLGACAANDYTHLPYYQKIGVKHPSPLNGFTGGVFVEPLSTDHIGLMQKRCSSYGGLDFSSQTTIHQSPLGEKVIEYKCNAANNKTQSPTLQSNFNTRTNSLNNNSNTPNTPTSPTSTSIDDAKTKCVELGFKARTEGFGKCVLQLSK